MWTALWQPKADVDPPKKLPFTSHTAAATVCLGPQLASNPKLCIAGPSASPYKASGRKWRIFRLWVSHYSNYFFLKCMCVCICTRGRTRVYVCRGVCVSARVYVYGYVFVCVCRWWSEDLKNGSLLLSLRNQGLNSDPQLHGQHLCLWSHLSSPVHTYDSRKMIRLKEIAPVWVSSSLPLLLVLLRQHLSPETLFLKLFPAHFPSAALRKYPHRCCHFPLNSPTG